METPTEPSISVSDPLKKELFYKYVKSSLHDSTNPILVDIRSINHFLSHTGLQIDSNGFIIDKETDEFVEPYNFSVDKFNTTESPSEQPLTDYLAPEEDCKAIIQPREKAHITDLHTIQRVNDQYHPIRSETVCLQQMVQCVGLTFRIIFKWSSNSSLLTDEADTVIEYNLSDDTPQELECLACEYSEKATEWTHTEDMVICPECDSNWTMNSLEICTACQSVFPFSEMTDEEQPSMHWKPKCPNCNAGFTMLHSQDRYTTFEDERTTVKPNDSEYTEEIRKFDYNCGT